MRLLIGEDAGVKYEKTKATLFSQVLRTFEETAPKPINYRATVSDLINSPYTTFGSAPTAANVLRMTKRLLSRIYAVQFTNTSYLIQFVQIDDYHKSGEYHQLNMIKAGHRAAKLGSIAYTRGLLGDVDTSLISEDVVDVALRGREIYDERYHKEPPAKPIVRAPMIARHLL